MGQQRGGVYIYTCKSKYHDYKDALYRLNVCKSNENRNTLCDKIRVYDQFIKKSKHNYKQFQGYNMEYLRKYNATQFSRLFKNKKKIGNDISAEDFFKNILRPFFENINKKSDVKNDVSQDTPPCYKELDICITELEVEKAKKLRCNKSNAEDGVVNDFFFHNDFERHFISSICTSIEIQIIIIFLIMYADDTVLITESAEGLHYM